MVIDANQLSFTFDYTTVSPKFWINLNFWDSLTG